jgi:hypothetical protein
MHHFSRVVAVQREYILYLGISTLSIWGCFCNRIDDRGPGFVQSSGEARLEGYGRKPDIAGWPQVGRGCDRARDAALLGSGSLRLFN